MTILFGICATVGVTLLICQLILTVVGIGGSDDFDGGSVDVGHDVGGHVHAGEQHGHSHHGSNWFFGVITVRTLIAAVAFFGLSGLGLSSSGASQIASLSGALLAGIGAMYLVHWMMNSLAYLKADGTTRIDRAIGAVGTVYVTIPAHNAGLGKVTLTIQSKSVELEARTPHEKLVTGAKVVVTRILGGEVVEVVATKSATEAVSV